MRRLVLLHTNDVHGRIEALARVATRVEQIRDEETAPTLYLDAGDVEETTVRISSLTKGVAMHRILSAAGCEVATVGNAGWLRYGPQILTAHASAASYPLLLANMEPVEGVRRSVLLTAGDWSVGVIGVTDDFENEFSGFDFGVRRLPVIPLVRELANDLRARGAELVVVLSHLGWVSERGAVTDRDLAEALQSEIDIVIGAHSHHLFPRGERVGRVLIAQAGAYAENLGRIDVDPEGSTATMVPIGPEVPASTAVLEAASSAELELEAYLDEVIGLLEVPLDTAFVAEVYRARMRADVGLATEGATLEGPLPPGPVRRGDLWDVCPSSGNPGVVEIDGGRLLEMLARGDDPAFQLEIPRHLRGRPRGRLLVAGPPTIEPTRSYRVAGSDWELDVYGGLIEREWGLEPTYDFPIIVREAVEEHLAGPAAGGPPQAP